MTQAIASTTAPLRSVSTSTPKTPASPAPQQTNAPAKAAGSAVQHAADALKMTPAMKKAISQLAKDGKNQSHVQLGKHKGQPKQSPDAKSFEKALSEFKKQLPPAPPLQPSQPNVN